MIPLIALFIMVLYIIILVYLSSFTFKNCKCAMNWKRDYILIFVALIIMINLITLLLQKNKHISYIFMAILLIAALINAVLMIKYAYEISENKCKCAMNPFAQFSMMFLGWFQIFIILFTIILFIIFNRKV
jgi:hypothetical protein